ncbi:MAG: hypothetical protein JW973_13330 [Bacteroidales bacterium]|nr:hypothetical protein [Bacteroidales bacterium]
MIKWYFDRERAFVEVTYTGDITCDQVQEYLDALGRAEGLPVRLCILSDMTEANNRPLFKSRKTSKMMNDIK